MENKNNRLTYERLNNSENVLSIDLHNGYSIIAISGWQPSNHNYKTSLYLKDNAIDTLSLIDQAESLEFYANNKTINSAILKQVSTYLENGFFDDYIKRYQYEVECFNVVNEIIEKANINLSTAS